MVRDFWLWVHLYLHFLPLVFYMPEYKCLYISRDRSIRFWFLSKTKPECTSKGTPVDSSGFSFNILCRRWGLFCSAESLKQRQTSLLLPWPCTWKFSLQLFHGEAAPPGDTPPGLPYANVSAPAAHFGQAHGHILPVFFPYVNMKSPPSSYWDMSPNLAFPWSVVVFICSVLTLAIHCGI